MNVFDRLEILTRTQGYIVWLDIQGKWHAQAYYMASGEINYVDWLLGEKQPWQNEPECMAVEVWVIPAPTRYQAIRIAKDDYKRKLLK